MSNMAHEIAMLSHGPRNQVRGGFLDPLTGLG
jgi:hypothetical protein